MTYNFSVGAAESVHNHHTLTLIGVNIATGRYLALGLKVNCGFTRVALYNISRELTKDTPNLRLVLPSTKQKGYHYSKHSLKYALTMGCQKSIFQGSEIENLSLTVMLAAFSLHLAKSGTQQVQGKITYVHFQNSNGNKSRSLSRKSTLFRSVRLAMTTTTLSSSFSLKNPSTVGRLW